MNFRFPYPFTFDPAAAQSGSPTISNRGRNELGSRDFFLQTNHDRPSMAHQLSSFGMDVGIPRDARDRPITGRSELLIMPFFDFNIFFWAGGTFASATTFGTVGIFVEEFDTRGNFVRGITGGVVDLFRSDTWWFSGSATGGPGGRSFVVLTPADRRIFATPGFFYRVWIDVHGEVRGAGFGGLGGSGAISQVFVKVQEVEVDFRPA